VILDTIKMSLHQGKDGPGKHGTALETQETGNLQDNTGRVDRDVFLKYYLNRFDPPTGWEHTRQEFEQKLAGAESEHQIAQTVSRMFTMVSLKIAKHCNCGSSKMPLKLDF
jgi:hypothetical protein